MNILFLTQIIPYPPDAGPKVKTWHVLRYLVERGHQVILASFMRPEEQAHVEVLEALCHQVYTVPLHRSRPGDLVFWLRSHLSGRPFLIERDDLPAMHTLLDRILAEQPVDIIHADQLTMTQFALPTKRNSVEMGKKNWHNRPVLVFDAHNAVWTILDRMHRNAPWFLKPVLNLETRRVKRYEGKILHAYDHTLAVTEMDRTALLEAAALPVNAESATPPDVSVIPIAVNTQEIDVVERPKNSTNILTLGTLHYPPNADGIRWFLQEVFPLVQKQEPAVTLTIIGKNPPKDFQQSASQAPESITVTGYVPKLTPYMEKAALMVIPVRAGGGMRVRILEAFARGVPVVTTTVGLEGIDASVGEDVLVADTPDDFAQAVLQLLHDPLLQSKLVQNGRQLAERHYDWQVVLKKLDNIYGATDFEPS